MLIQVRGVSVHAMSGIELSRVRTEFRLRLPEPINKRPLESSGADIVMQSCEVLVRDLASYATNQALTREASHVSQLGSPDPAAPEHRLLSREARLRVSLSHAGLASR
jgi:hypothetical protein